MSYSLYSVIPSPVDDSVWGVAETFPGYLVRVKRGNNPPETCMTQLFKVPSPGLDPRGVDIDSNGVVWTALAASSHLASFDVRKCTDLNGPAKAGRQPVRQRLDALSDHRTEVPGHRHPDGLPLLQLDRSAGRLGLPGQHADGDGIELRFDSRPESAERTVDHLRVPYPLGFYARGLDARVDDPKAPAGFAGWKSRAIWSNYGTHFVWHIEGGKGTKGKEVKFQVRPNPLAR